MKLVGADMTILRNRFEHRFDLLGGTWLGQNTYAGMYRFGINLDQEGRLKIEAQPMWSKFGDQNNFEMSLCFSNQLTSNLTLRVGYWYDTNVGDNRSDNRVIFQIYYYRPI
jgi:hypothetical protein